MQAMKKKAHNPENRTTVRVALQCGCVIGKQDSEILVRRRRIDQLRFDL
jgi:hypothetical protein